MDLIQLFYAALKLVLFDYSCQELEGLFLGFKVVDENFDALHKDLLIASVELYLLKNCNENVQVSQD